MISHTDFYLIIALALFSIGTFGVLVKKNTIVMLMCLTLMFNAVNLALVVFSRIHGNIEGQVFAMLITGVVAAQIALGLVIIMNRIRNQQDLQD